MRHVCLTCRPEGKQDRPSHGDTGSATPCSCALFPSTINTSRYVGATGLGPPPCMRLSQPARGPRPARAGAPALRRPSALLGAEELGGLAHVARGHPQDGPVTAGASADGVDGRHVDLRLGELPVQLGHRTDALLATHQDGTLGAGELPFGRPRELLEGGRIGGNEVELRAASFGEAREREEIDTGLLERRQKAGALARLVGHLRVEVLDALNRVGHGRSPLGLELGAERLVESVGDVGRGNAQGKLGTRLGGEMTLERLDESGSTCTLPSSPRIVENQPLEIGEGRGGRVVWGRVASLAWMVPVGDRLRAIKGKLATRAKTTGRARSSP